MRLLISRLTGLDVRRDGGSLEASFEAFSGDQYWLRFQVSDSESESSGHLSYKKAMLERFILKDGQFQHFEPTQLSWGEARELLADMYKHVEAFETDYRWVFTRMSEVASSDGAFFVDRRHAYHA